jgi:hypothetical protein
MSTHASLFAIFLRNSPLTSLVKAKRNSGTPDDEGPPRLIQSSIEILIGDRHSPKHDRPINSTRPGIETSQSAEQLKNEREPISRSFLPGSASKV